MSHVDQAGPDLAAASIEAVSGVPVHMMVSGLHVVLIGEEQFRSLAGQKGVARPQGRPCRPMTMVELADIVGTERAGRLAYARRHSPRIAVPPTAHDDHWLVRLIGRSATDLLCAALQQGQPRSVTVLLPQVSPPGRFYADARQKAASMTAKGLSAKAIAHALGVSKRSVEKWREKARAEAATRIAGRRGRASSLQRKRIDDDV